MDVHKFQKKTGSMVILTPDRAGADLPGGPNAWFFEKTLSLNENDPPRIGASSKDILAAIKRDGFYKWPDGK